MDFYEELLRGVEPLGTTLKWLYEQGKLTGELTLYQQDFYVHPLSGERTTAVRCICSSCQTTYYAQESIAGGCNGRYTTAPFGLWKAGESYISGMDYECPYCGELTKLYYSGRLNTYGDAYIEGVTVTEIRNIDGKLCVMEWELSKRCSKQGVSAIHKQPREAYVLDNGKLVRLSGMRRWMNSYTRFARFERLKGYVDMLGRTSCIAPFDASLLNGTEAENSKLDIYIGMALARNGECMPVSFLRSWLKYPKIENLLSCGAARLFADIFTQEYKTASEYSGNCKRIIKYESLDLKKVRPSEMLGLSTEEFRTALQRDWGLQELEAYRRLKETAEPFSMDDLPLMVKYGASEVREMKEYGLKVVRTIRYLGRQGEAWYTLKDYYQMAQRMQMPLDRQILRYPKNLRQAHDDLMRRQKLKAQKEKIEAFAASSEKYKALQWDDKELCVLLPQTQEELIAEGNVLQHCVGGYADSHIKGKIILFVRHYRRPERSYYTLNVDMTGERPRRIQLHGYGNEHHGEHMQHRHSIPKKVLEFVDRWEREVLLPQWAKLKKKGA